MTSESHIDLTRCTTVRVPLVHSTRRHPRSALWASLAMAVAYARGDQSGDRYRDLLELCLDDAGESIAMAVTTARRLFPDVPVSHHEASVMSMDDAICLAQLAAQRGGRLLPVFAFDERFQSELASVHPTVIVLSTFSAEDPKRREFWEPEPPAAGGRRVSSRVDAVPDGYECLMFGWLPPAFANESPRVR